MTNREKFIALAKDGLYASQIADKLGITRQRVHQLSKSEGIHLPKAPLGAPTRANATAKNRHKYDTRISPTWSGAISEHIVGVDLIKRGYYVYAAMARTGPFDLFAYSREMSWRVEVKSINSRGQTCNINPHDCDLVARVMPDGDILYSHDPGVVQQKRRWDI